MAEPSETFDSPLPLDDDPADAGPTKARRIGRKSGPDVVASTSGEDLRLSSWDAADIRADAATSSIVIPAEGDGPEGSTGLSMDIEDSDYLDEMEDLVHHTMDEEDIFPAVEQALEDFVKSHGLAELMLCSITGKPLESTIGDPEQREKLGVFVSKVAGQLIKGDPIPSARMSAGRLHVLLLRLYTGHLLVLLFTRSPSIERIIAALPEELVTGG